MENRLSNESVYELIMRVMNEGVSNFEDIDNYELAEFLDSQRKVHSELSDQRRWYNIFDEVVMIENRYIGFCRIQSSNENNSVKDIGMEEVSDIEEVYPIEVTKVKYVKENYFGTNHN